jgi:hypothetical protein
MSFFFNHKYDSFNIIFIIVLVTFIIEKGNKLKHPWSYLEGQRGSFLPLFFEFGS